MFSRFAALPSFHGPFPLEKVEMFWNLVEKSGDERLQDHPCKGRGWKKRTALLWLHADGVEYTPPAI